MPITYVTKTDIVAWVNMQLACANNSITAETIPDVIMNWGHTKTIVELVKLKVKDIPTTDDDYHFLQFATMAIILDLLCKEKVITQSSGDVMRSKFGDIQHDFQKANPLFFFATGSSQPFQRLLPYETLRMYFYSFIEAYVKRKFYERTGSTVPTPKLVHDGTKGGYNWDNQMTSELGEISEDLEIYDPYSGISDDEDETEDWERD